MHASPTVMHAAGTASQLLLLSTVDQSGDGAIMGWFGFGSITFGNLQRTDLHEQHERDLSLRQETVYWLPRGDSAFR